MRVLTGGMTCANGVTTTVPLYQIPQGSIISELELSTSDIAVVVQKGINGLYFERWDETNLIWLEGFELGGDFIYDAIDHYTLVGNDKAKLLRVDGTISFAITNNSGASIEFSFKMVVI